MELSSVKDWLTCQCNEYSRFGVLSMEDRVRLFKLVQIVKSVLADGLHCQHEHPALRSNSTRTYLTSDAHGRNISELARIQGQRNNANVEAKPIPPIISKLSRGNARSKVEYNPGSDTPVFKCRKILTFSDSEEEQEEEEKRSAKSKQYQSFPKSVAVAAVKPTAVDRGNTQLTVGPDTKSRNSHEDVGQVKQQNHESPKSKPSQAFYV